MLRRYSSTTLASAVAAAIICSAVNAENIAFHSGNGAIGGNDSLITYYAPADGAIGPFSTEDFAAADAGPPAIVLNAYGGWMSSLPADPSAKWIAVNSAWGALSALYSYTFQVSTTSIGSASVTLNFSVDNALGESSVPGLYLNGLPIAGSNGLGTYSNQFTFSSDQIGPLLHAGTNTLYFYQYDQGVVAGSIFSGEIDITPAAQAIGIVVKPHFPGNDVLLKQSEVFVSVMGSDVFEVSAVDISSVRFGPGDALASKGKGWIRDINSDGYPDLVLGFATVDTGIVPGTQTVTLSGSTTAGMLFTGFESITAQ